MFCKSYFAEQTIFGGQDRRNIPSTISYTLQWNVLTEMVTIAIFFSQSSNNRLASNSPLFVFIRKKCRIFHLLGIKIITSYDHNYITLQNCLPFCIAPREIQ